MGENKLLSKAILRAREHLIGNDSELSELIIEVSSDFLQQLKAEPEYFESFDFQDTSRSRYNGYKLVVSNDCVDFNISQIKK